jgi:hypothetical protein
MCNYKVVGLDLVLQTPEYLLLTGNKMVVKGRVRFFQPTEGRCNAMRNAFDQMKSQMKNQGIDYRTNRMYDFRAPLRAESNYPNNAVFGPVALQNLATMDGIRELSLTEGAGGDATSIFDAYNTNVLPVADPTANLFGAGLATQQSVASGATDYVLNDTAIGAANPLEANTTLEEIPFVLVFQKVPGENFRVTGLNWRPDPALYLSVLTGQMEVVIDEVEVDDGVEPGPETLGFEIDMSIHVAGWKSIARTPRSTRRDMKKGK